MKTIKFSAKASPISYMLLLLALLFSSLQLQAEENSEAEPFNQAQLAQMLAPIALYPDTLLTHILIASTYPLEVIEAERWLTNNKNLSTQRLQDKSEQKKWDPSVKALLSFPRVLKNLSEDLTWMQQLGDAFLQDEAQVLSSIQTLRRKADDAGNLNQMDNVDIVREQRTIIIEPAEPEVIYVPYYDTRVVYGNWHWSHYPPVYWHTPRHYAYYHGPFYWHSGTHIAVDFFFSAFHWSNRHVVVHHHKKRYHHSSRRIATSHGAKRWNHNPNHRRGVAYRSKKMKTKYYSNRPSTQHSQVVRKSYRQKQNTSSGGQYKSRYASEKQHRVHDRLKVNKAVKVTHSRKKTSYKNKNSERKVITSNKESRQRYVNSTDRKSSVKSHSGTVKSYKNKNYQNKSYKVAKQITPPAPKSQSYKAPKSQTKSYQSKERHSSTKSRSKSSKSRQGNSNRSSRHKSSHSKNN